MSSQTVDELIMCLVGMGFEIEDCQEAIQRGKLNVQDVVEWILAGKPTADPSSVEQSARGSTLRLGNQRSNEVRPDNVIGSNPFLNPQPAAAVAMDTSGPSSEKTEQEEDKVQSRFMRNEEQRKVKERFEEKQRLEVQKKAAEEKIAKKKAHEQVLAQIKEDRERAKILKSSSPPKAVSVPPSTAAQQPKSSGPSSDKAMIQVRLPGGRAIRQQFKNNTVLQEVWDFVVEKFPAAHGLCLVQPFPRVEYGSGDMEKTLTELSLVPSGSLVLNKPQNKDKPPEHTESMETAESKGEVTTPAVPTLPILPPHTHLPVHPPPLGGGGSHHWGGGHSLGGAEELLPQQETQPPGDSAPHPMDPVDISDPESSEQSDSDDDDVGGNHPGMGGFPPGGGGAMFPPGFGGGGGGGHDAMHFWGEGQRLIGEVLNQNNLPHQRQDPKQLAAEAARQRYTTNPPAGSHCVAMDIGASSVHHPSPEIPTLSSLLIQHLCARICDPRHPLLSLQGVPADLADKVIEYLIKEKLLKPKTLKPFISCRLRKLTLDCYPYTTNELVAAIKYHKYLLQLSMCSCPLITDNGLQPLAGLSRLKLLNVAGCRQLTNNCLTVIKEMHSLVTLILEDTGVTDEGIITYAKSSPEQLHTLDLSRTNITHNILQALAGLTQLRVLSLEGTQIGSLSGVQRLEKLEGLNVANTPIVTESLLCLQQLKELKALNISNTENVVGDLALQYLAGLQLQVLNLPSRLSTTDEGIKYLKDMPLHILDLTNYINVGDVAMESVCDIQHLKKLRLGNTKVSDAGMIFLQKLTHLEELLLDRTSVTDIGVEVVGAMTALQELSLSETGITNGILTSGKLNQCVMLSKLNLSKTHITDKGIVHLKCPHLLLLNIDNTFVRPATADSLQKSNNLPQLTKITYKNLKTPNESDEEM